MSIKFLNILAFSCQISVFFDVHAGSCFRELGKSDVHQRLELLAAHPTHPKIRQVKVYYPIDFKAGEPRDVLVYMHGFGSNAEAYEKVPKEGLSVQQKISQLYQQKNAKEPVVLSFSMGSTALAGHPSHPDGNKFFVPVQDYWMALEGPLTELPLQRRKLMFLANSGGAWSVFQMLRNIPSQYEVNGAVLVALPHFTSTGLAPNPSIKDDGTSLDPVGGAIREQLTPIVSDFLLDPYFENLNPMASLRDASLPRNVPLLIQGGEWDALGYSSLNRQFTDLARQHGYPVRMHLVPGGHANGIDNQATVNFLTELGN